MNKQLISPYIMLIFLAFMAGRHIFPNVNSTFNAIDDQVIEDTPDVLIKDDLLIHEIQPGDTLVFRPVITK